MLKTVIFTLSIAASALISGFSLTTLIWSMLSICLILWKQELFYMKEERGYVVNDPANYNPVVLRQALEDALCQSVKSNRRLILKISNPGINTVKIDINPNGSLQISDAHRSIPIDFNQGSWIPNHQLPLILKAGLHSTLIFSPLKDGRISSSTAITPAHKLHTSLLLLPFAVFFIYDINGAAAALLSVIFYNLLMQQISEH